MRVVLRIIAGLALVWVLWWAALAIAVKSGTATLMNGAQGEGWRATASGTEVRGFPHAHVTTVHDITLTDVDHDQELRLVKLLTRFPSYWPGHLRLQLPMHGTSFSTRWSDYFLVTEDAEARLRLRPGLALELASVEIGSGPSQVTTALGRVLSAARLSAQLRQGATRATYELDFAAEALTPGPALALPAVWDVPFAVFEGAATLVLRDPITRHSLQPGRLRPVSFKINDISASWGPAELRAAGTVEVAADGTPQGAVVIDMRGWRPLFDLSVKTGALDPLYRLQVELTLNALANLSDDPEVLRLDLQFREGSVFLGPITLGPAPNFGQQ